MGLDVELIWRCSAQAWLNILFNLGWLLFLSDFHEHRHFVNMQIHIWLNQIWETPSYLKDFLIRMMAALKETSFFISTLNLECLTTHFFENCHCSLFLLHFLFYGLLIVDFFLCCYWVASESLAIYSSFSRWIIPFVSSLLYWAPIFIVRSIYYCLTLFVFSPLQCFVW